MTRPVFLDARRDLFGSLIDYAGLFPPASLDLDAALAEYRSARAGPHAWMLGSFVIPANRLIDLAGILVATMSQGEQPWDVSVILGADPARAAAEAASFESHMAPAAQIVGVEAALPPSVSDGRDADAAASVIRGTATAAVSVSGRALPFLEIPPGPGREAAAAAVSHLRGALGRPLGGKLRCGGLTADAFPSPATVAAFIAACTRLELPFKATAGLHHPVRHRDADLGVMRHGFLNLLIAAAAAEAGAAPGEVEEIVAETDGSALQAGTAGARWRDRRYPASTVKHMRETSFRSYGSCSFDEPVTDLADLGLISPLPA
jgi:hypothetical protein